MRAMRSARVAICWLSRATWTWWRGRVTRGAADRASGVERARGRLVGVSRVRGLPRAAPPQCRQQAPSLPEGSLLRAALGDVPLAGHLEPDRLSAEQPEAKELVEIQR